MQRGRREPHRVAASVDVAKAAGQVRDARLARRRLDPARDQKVLALQEDVALARLDGVSAVQRRVRRVEHGRRDDLRGP